MRFNIRICRLDGFIDGLDDMFEIIICNLIGIENVMVGKVLSG